MVADPAFVARTRGIGVLSRDTAAAYGGSGPVARVCPAGAPS